MHDPDIESFGSFGDLLRYLRRRRSMTLRELGNAVGYSEAHMARLENGQRLPNLSTVQTAFIPALVYPGEAEISARLIALAQSTHAQSRPEPEYRPDTAGQIQSPDASASRPTTRAERTVNPYGTVSLPAQWTRFVGREHEMVEVEELLVSTRMLTLAGFGGVGKTRLALEVAARLAEASGAADQSPAPFPDGIRLVDLASLGDAELLPDKVSVALGLQPIRRTALAVISDYFQDRRALLILDNCEHVISACAALCDHLLRSCRHLHILATSREPLNIPGEVVYHLSALTTDEAVQLFVERAKAVKPTFRLTSRNTATVIDICRRLDKMPLALELAAARLRTFSVEQITARLGDVFQLLASGHRTALPHHQTLRALIDWSYSLLPEEERALLCDLSVFVGGWTLEAVEALHGTSVLDRLDQLVSKSLVVADASSDADELAPETAKGARYRLLQVIWQYTREKLESDTRASAVRQWHLEYYANLAQAAKAQIDNSQGKKAMVELIETELDNIGAALDWAAKTGEWRIGERLIDGAYEVFGDYGHGTVLAGWIDQVLLSNPTVGADTRLRALMWMGNLATNKGDMVRSVDWRRQASRLAHQLNDQQLVLLADQSLGFVMQDFAQAVTLLREVIDAAHRAGQTSREISALTQLGHRMRLNGDYSDARTILDTGVALARFSGNPNNLSSPLWRLGELLLELGDYAQARACLEESIGISRTAGESNRIYIELIDLGLVGLCQGDVALARQAIHECIPYHYKVDNLERVAQVMGLAAGMAQSQGKLVTAAQLLAAVAAMRKAYATHGLFERELFWDSDRRLPVVRSLLPSPEFDAAWDYGQQLAIKDAIALALTV